MNKIKVLIVEPGKEPYEKKIKNSLKSLQNEVSGFIKFMEIEKEVDLILNEEGKINNLPFNRYAMNDILCGTFIVAGQINGETIALNNKMIEKYKEYFKLSNHEQIVEQFKNRYGSSSELVRCFQC